MIRVTGATGPLGRAGASRLARRGHERDRNDPGNGLLTFGAEYG
jgi:NAD(P)-dependent dehydrogenase (short-subunit alcohol dehydrogenase family)